MPKVFLFPPEVKAGTLFPWPIDELDRIVPGVSANGAGENGQSNAAENGTAHIEVRSLQKNFGETKVLKDVNMSIGRGHIAVIIGGSGAGKTSPI